MQNICMIVHESDNVLVDIQTNCFSHYLRTAWDMWRRKMKINKKRHAVILVVTSLRPLTKD